MKTPFLITRQLRANDAAAQYGKQHEILIFAVDSLLSEFQERYNKLYEARLAASDSELIRTWLRDKADGVRFKETHQRLLALGEAPNPDDVDAVLGNDSWTVIFCDSCRRKSPTIDAVVYVGEEPGHDTSTARLCRACLGDAVACLEQTR